MTRRADLAIIDDDAAVLDSLGVLLKGQGFTSVRTFASAGDALSALDEGYAPACIVSDVRMAGLSGLELQQELIRRGVRAPLILITGHGDIGMAVKSIKAGAADFIEKPFEASTLIEAIDRALAVASLAEATLRMRESISGKIAQLSQRQRQVMELVVRGYSSKEIAAQLEISPRTVETYRLWIMEKTGARNLADLVRMVTQLESGQVASVDDSSPQSR